MTLLLLYSFPELFFRLLLSLSFSYLLAIVNISFVVLFSFSLFPIKLPATKPNIEMQETLAVDNTRPHLRA